jgi:hypothetical protein
MCNKRAADDSHEQGPCRRELQTPILDKYVLRRWRPGSRGHEKPMNAAPTGPFGRKVRSDAGHRLPLKWC